MKVTFLPKSKEIESCFDRITKYPVIRIDPKIAQTISRHKKIRFLREQDKIYFAKDKSKHKSIMGLPPQTKVKKENGIFIFRY